MTEDSYEYEQAVREKKERDEVRNAVRLLSALANRGAAPRLFVEEMAGEHRTLQQGMTGMMLAWFAHLAALPEGHYDARNEAAVRVARKVVAATEGVTRLPLI